MSFDTFPHGKVLQSDYDNAFLADGHDLECDVCLTRGEISAIVDMLPYLSWETRWYSPSEIAIDTDAIDALRSDIFYRLAIMACCNSQILSRFTSDGTYQQSLDGGVTWQDAPNADPRNQTTVFSDPVSGDPGNDKKCSSANSGVKYFQNVVASLQTAKDNEAGLADLTAILIGFLIILGIITGGWLFAFIGGFLAVLATNISAAQWEAAFTSDFWQDFLCILFCDMEDDGTWTKDDWQQALGDVATMSGDQIAIDFVTDMLKGLGPNGLTNVGRMGLDAGLTCTSCPCVDVCAANWSLSFPEDNRFGVIVSVDLDEGSVTVATDAVNGDGHYYIDIRTPDADTCCIFDHADVVSGTHNQDAWQDCGDAFDPGGLTVGIIAGHCINHYQSRGDAPYSFKIFFTDCS